MPSYTTQNLAKLLNVSSQTIRNAIKALNLNIEKPKGNKSFVLSHEQAEQIAKHLNKELSDECGSSRTAPNQSIEEYKEQIEFLKKQIAAKDKLITEQSETIQSLVRSNEALSSSHALNVAAEKKDLLLVDSNVDNTQETKKRSFLQRLFG